jgi:hypothetical protein
MTTPKFAPIAAEDEIRDAYRLEPPRPWVLHRPGELGKPDGQEGRGRGTPGPDQGYALGLALRLAERVVLSPGEHVEDALAGAVVLALRRASSFGRAPVLGDIELALGLFGFLSEAPADLVAYRRRQFDGVAHDYWRQRQLAESVPLESLRPPGGAKPAGTWREQLGSPAPTA